jgi:phosphoribosylglycinamide formyltransferase 2
MTIGTPLTQIATRALLLGSGELGKDVTIELQRYGVEVIACDRYENAPAMQVAHRSYVFNMLDGKRLREIVEKEHPSLIIPEVEAIATPTLVELEKEGYHVIPTAHAAFLTMNREAIRRLASEELHLPTAPYLFADNHDEFIAAVKKIGIPCVVKPIMSSSGHGQSTIHTEDEVETAWNISQEGGRAGAGRVIVEGFIHFDYEITLLTVRHIGGTTFLNPIGHHQVEGDYRESWQPQAMSEQALKDAQRIAKLVTDALGGFGIFGVEMFVRGNEVIFSEVSPRPHDTGMVTMISQDLSEFALHARAVLGLPIPEIRFFQPSASKAIVIEGEGSEVTFNGLEKALAIPGVQLRIFGKPAVHGHRRYGVILATDQTVEKALDKAEQAYKCISYNVK